MEWLIPGSAGFVMGAAAVWVAHRALRGFGSRRAAAAAEAPAAPCWVDAPLPGARRIRLDRGEYYRDADGSGVVVDGRIETCNRFNGEWQGATVADGVRLFMWRPGDEGSPIPSKTVTSAEGAGEFRFTRYEECHPVEPDEKVGRCRVADFGYRSNLAEPVVSIVANVRENAGGLSSATSPVSLVRTLGAPPPPGVETRLSVRIVHASMTLRVRGAFSVAGSLAKHDGSPIAGARVYVALSDRGEAPLAVTTDDAGGFRADSTARARGLLVATATFPGDSEHAAAATESGGVAVVGFSTRVRLEAARPNPAHVGDRVTVQGRVEFDPGSGGEWRGFPDAAVALSEGGSRWGVVRAAASGDFAAEERYRVPGARPWVAVFEGGAEHEPSLPSNEVVVRVDEEEDARRPADPGPPPPHRRIVVATHLALEAHRDDAKGTTRFRAVLRAGTSAGPPFPGRPVALLVDGARLVDGTTDAEGAVAWDVEDGRFEPGSTHFAQAYYAGAVGADFAIEATESPLVPFRVSGAAERSPVVKTQWILAAVGLLAVAAFARAGRGR